jgi:hypothetical protein
MRRLFFCVVVSFFIATGSTARGVTVSITSSTNPETLPVGYTVTFDVQLSGLESKQELDLLAATIDYDKALLGVPTIVKGGILPDPLADSSHFMLSEDEGLADGSFYTSSDDPAQHISDNGIFFSFSTEVLAPGSGSFSFSYVDATQFPGTDVDVTESALSFRSVIVPEPSTCALLAMAVLVFFAHCLRRRLLSSAFGR